VSRREYFKKWYEENKEQIAAKRRRRYRNDPKYRRKCIEQARKNREKTQPEKYPTLDPSRVLIGGKVYFTVRGLAHVLEKSRNSVYYWIRSGFLPPPQSVDGSNTRYYTAAQVVMIREGLREHLDKKRLSPSDIQSFKAYISERWEDGRKETIETVGGDSEGA
jgi:hypothetical protein